MSRHPLRSASLMLLAVVGLRGVVALEGSEWWGLLAVLIGLVLYPLPARWAAALRIVFVSLAGILLCEAIVFAPGAVYWGTAAGIGLLGLYLSARRDRVMRSWPRTADAAAWATLFLFLALVVFDRVLASRAGMTHGWQAWAPAAALLVLSLLVYAAASRWLWPERAPRARDSLAALVEGSS